MKVILREWHRCDWDVKVEGGYNGLCSVTSCGSDAEGTIGVWTAVTTDPPDFVILICEFHAKELGE